MRNCSYLVIVISILLCLSCSHDDDTTDNMPLVGHWLSVSKHQYLVDQETGETFVTEETPYIAKTLDFYNNGKCKCDNINVICDYTIVDNILDIYGKKDVVDNALIVRGNYYIEELSNDRLVLRETAYGYSYKEKVFGEPLVYYESHDTYTFIKSK